MVTSTSDGDTGDSGNGEPSPAVTGYDRTTAGDVDVDRWAEVAKMALVGESVIAGQLDLIFVDVDEMAELNVAHMGHEGPTDVLSFPLDGDDDDQFPGGDDGPGLDGVPNLDGVPDGASGLGGGVPIHLGDVVVCPEVAERQAPEHCGTLEAELSLLIIHGVLHILGHDHAEPAETKIMQDRERQHLGTLGIAHPVRA